MSFTKKITAGLLLLVLLGFYPLPTQSKAIKIKIGDGRAVVTLLKGSASVFRKGVAKPKPVSQGDHLIKGDRITTGVQSRIEIKMPDKSLVRFDEKTTFVLAAVAHDRKSRKSNIKVDMILGKTWANVPKFSGRKGRFAITTKTSVAGVRGTDFRMNVNKDNSAVLKVYDGEVEVSRRKDADVAGEQAIYTKPTPVAGPHPVTMEEWTYIVRSLHQINIRPDGTAAKPFRFDIAADLNDWVRWNQARNQRLLKQGR